MCLDSFLKASKGNNRISKSRAFHNVGAAYPKDLSENELEHIVFYGWICYIFRNGVPAWPAIF